MEEKMNWKLALILVFLGCFGIAKFYVNGFKKGWKVALVKFLANIIFIGEIWNIVDIIMFILKRYEFDPRDYLAQIEAKRDRK